MGAAFLITLREGLEAVLIVAIVMAYLRQLGRADQFALVAAGALAGVAVSIAAGTGIYLAIGELEGRAEAYTEAIIALTAAGVLTWMVFWMRKQARSLGGALRSEVDHALASGAVLGLASIVFIGVVREGLETALFMLAVVFDAGVMSTTIGAVAGLAGAVVLGYAVYRGSQLVNLRLFFQVTGGLVILFAAGLFAKGIFQLQALGVMDSMYWPVWDLTGTAVIGHGDVYAFLRGIFGWSAQPSLEQVVVWITYVATASWFFYFGALPDSVTSRADQLRSAIARAVAPRSSRIETEVYAERDS